MSSHGPNAYHPDGTESLLWALCESPTLNVRCSVGSGDPALAVFHTPNGCAARPDDKFQAVCDNHMITDGLGEGSRPILDLTIGERWSQEGGLTLPLRLGFSALQLQDFLSTIPEG